MRTWRDDTADKGSCQPVTAERWWCSRDGSTRCPGTSRPARPAVPWRADVHARRPSGQKIELAVSRPDNREVPAIKCGHLDDAKALGCDHHRGVHRPEGHVPVYGHQLSDAEPICGGNRLRDEVACGKVAHEAHLGIDAKVCAEQVAHLGDDKLRDEQRPGMALQELETLGVVGVVAVDVGVQRPGVNDQRDVPTSPAKICSMRSEMSAWPLAPAPAARRRRRVWLPPR